MCSEVVDPEKLMTEFQEVAKQLEEVLKDLEWRKPDVEGEEAKLKALEEQAKTDPGVDVASQRIVVRVFRGVLDDKIAEAERLEKRMLELEAALEQISRTEVVQGEVGESGEAVHKKEEQVG